MSGLVLDIDDWAVAPGAPAYIERLAPYFLLMTGSNIDVTWYRKGTRIGSAKGFQGGDGVGPLSADFDRIVLESTTPQTVKVAISSDPVTITRLSGTVKVDGVIQTAPDFSRVQSRQSFFTLSGQGNIAGEYSFVQIWNPDTALKELVLPEIYIKAATTVQLIFTDTEATAVNLNNYAEEEALNQSIGSPVEGSGAKWVKKGSSGEAGILNNAAGLGLSLIGTGWLQQSQPIILRPGAGLAIRSAGVQEAIVLGAQIFEVEP